MKTTTKLLLGGAAIAVGVYLYRRSKASPVPKVIMPGQTTAGVGGVFGKMAGAFSGAVSGATGTVS